MFFEATEVGIIGISLYKNDLELIVSDISFKWVSPQQI